MKNKISKAALPTGYTVERRVMKGRKTKKQALPLRGANDDVMTKNRVKPRKTTNKALDLASKLGKTEFFVRGKNGVRALAAVSKICRVESVVTSGEGVGFKAPSKVCDKIVALLDNLCYDYKIIRVDGFAPRALNVLLRAGLVAGILLSLALTAIYPLFVTRVSVADVSGGAIDGALNAKVQGILIEHGLRAGAFVPSVDLKAVSEEITALDGVSFASTKRRGTHVTVLLKKELKSESFVGITGSTVRSTQLATVTRVVVEGGTALVKYGDVVKPGDALIDGYALYGEDKIPVEAKGMVYGTVLKRATVHFDDVEVVREYGETKRITKLSMFSKAPKPPKSPFDEYELKVERYSLGFLFPIEIYSFEYRECKDVERPLEASDEELIKRVYSSLVAEIDGAAKITDMYSGVVKGNGRTVTVTLQIETLISD